MNDFTQDELTLMSIYNGAGTRQGLIDSLTDMRLYLNAEDTELRALTDSALSKLSETSDANYTVLDLYPEFRK